MQGNSAAVLNVRDKFEDGVEIWTAKQMRRELADLASKKAYAKHDKPGLDLLAVAEETIAVVYKRLFYLAKKKSDEAMRRVIDDEFMNIVEGFREIMFSRNSRHLAVMGKCLGELRKSERVSDRLKECNDSIPALHILAASGDQEALGRMIERAGEDDRYPAGSARAQRDVIVMALAFGQGKRLEWGMTQYLAYADEWGIWAIREALVACYGRATVGLDNIGIVMYVAAERIGTLGKAAMATFMAKYPETVPVFMAHMNAGGQQKRVGRKKHSPTR